MIMMKIKKIKKNYFIIFSSKKKNTLKKNNTPCTISNTYLILKTLNPKI
jgi:hypothetical protein